MNIELHIFTNCTYSINERKTIKESYDSFVKTFGNLPLTIWVDENPNNHEFANYNRYLNNIFPDVNINKTISLSDGYIKMIQSTKADFIFVLEHDWIFVKENIHHSLNEICIRMKSHNACHTRFNKNHNYIDDSVEWSDMTPQLYDEVFCKALSASNNPHIINVEEYRNTAFKYIKLDSGPWGIEDNLRNRNDCLFLVYGTKSNKSTIIHRDGKMNRTDQIKRLYNLILGREADESGLNGYVNSSLNLYQIQVEMWQSDEFKSRFNHINPIEPSIIEHHIPIFVINLERRPDRKEQIINTLHNVGVINYEIINAIDGQKLTEIDIETKYDDIRARNIHRHMTHYEIACSLSHIECAKKIIEDKLEYAVILEDDAELTLEFKQFLRNFDSSKNYGFDYLILGAFSSNQFFNGKLKTKEAPHYLIEKESIIYLDHSKYSIGDITIHDSHYPTKQLDYVHGTHAYIMSNSGARKLLEKNLPVIVEADNMWNYFPGECNIEFTNPILCHRQHEDSDIHVGRYDLVNNDKNFSKHFLRRKYNENFGT